MCQTRGLAAGLAWCAVAFPAPASPPGPISIVIGLGRTIAPEQARAMMEREEAWRGVTAGLHGAVGSTDRRYARGLVPDLAETDGGRRWSAVAWRGERASGQVVLWTGEGARQVRLAASALRSEAGDELPRDCLQVRFVRYVLGDGQVLGDVLDTAARLDLAPHSARPVWVSVEPPADARPGLYRGRVEVRAEGVEPLAFEVEVEVLPAVLPPAAEWAFRLDLWQNPYALARYHHVEPWSPQHLALLEPHLRLLAGAGQKCITTTIVYQPWGTQTYDPYDSMVEWTRRADGTWSFDYTHFDQYVELCDRCGIRDSISCYSMVPWTNRFRYLDEATGDYAYVQAAPGTEEYATLWRAFLGDFVVHLRERGWLERAAIAMDERPAELMKPMLALLREAAPGLKVALAGSNEPELKDAVDDWCVFISPALDPTIARERAERGRPTTFYVCCGPGRPNTFTFSPPAEAAWLGLYAAAKGYSGLLRWAFDSWVEDPLWDTSYVTWPAGDCFLTYPGPRSSVRFERLREGIQDYEKIRLLREALAGRDDEAVRDGLRRLDEALAGFTFEQAQKEPAAEAVSRVRAVLVELSRLAAGG